MAHRIRNCANSTNLECDTFSSRMRREKLLASQNKLCSVQKCPRNCSASNIKPTNVSNSVLNALGQTLKSRSGTERVQQQPKLLNPSSTNHTRKEIIRDDDGMAEYTTRVSSRASRPNSETTANSKESWGKLLQPKKNSNATPFNEFDPLRTLHFLGKELHSKLRSNLSGDQGVLQMISDMQVALNRIPPEVASNIQQFVNKEFRSKKLIDIPAEPPEKLMESYKPRVEHKGNQTVASSANAIEAENFQKQLEASSLKLEMHCKQIEKQLVNMKMEKEQLERSLNAEKDTVKNLYKQIEDVKNEKVETSNAAFQQLVQERDSLRNQVKKLENFTNRPTPSAQEFKSLIQELQTEKAVVKQENLTLRHKLTISNMEKDKFIAILNIRDRQISEIRQEMSQLQDAVNDQLSELQKCPYLSAPSSQSTFVDNLSEGLWQQLQLSLEKCENAKEIQDQLTPSSANSDTVLNNIFKNGPSLFHTFQELPSGESSTTYVEPLTLKMKKSRCKPGTSQKGGMTTSAREAVET